VIVDRSNNRIKSEAPMVDGQTNAGERESPWMTIKEVADYLSVSAGTVRNWVSQRYIPFARRGRVVRFHRESIDRWLNVGASKGRRMISRQQPGIIPSMTLSCQETPEAQDQPEVSG